MKFILTLISGLVAFSANAEAIRWNPIPIIQPQQPQVIIQQQNYSPYDFSALANAMQQYGAARSSETNRATPIAPQPVTVTYEKNPDGTVSRCERVGENMFCK